MKKGKIDLYRSDLVMKFDLEKMIKKPTIDGQTFWIDTVDEITKEIMQAMHSEGPLEVALVQIEDEFGY